MIHSNTTYFVKFVITNGYSEAVNFLDQSKYIFGRKLDHCGLEGLTAISIGPYSNPQEATDASNEVVNLANRMGINLRDL
ncbi:hypothetical protein LAh9_27 [Aeromonas phage LAh_9]|uniref:Uncharacterized protein n=4 Tax=Lahexavirus TaxID=2843411 RepID=A0A514A158_9CAUD|nr:hypothetical protein HWC29_gp082 [Aeromonas phage 4_4572]YP_009847317.1 hypothetical protein HWC30_gp143 [Aeromonas phage LAh_6]YP_009847376.1 hypothetical protein HWC31_gp038 [Aeromonas phage LAh_8]YP_009847508.1 hypothetical protein HWC32_gp027 [Aeromonas phage LAh_9]QDH46586.1 hypothetical protein LAh6_143 [Aeromonas phage LAh_6]QDH46820.1 hypothetical protein LAh8_38 [Aeromonas phage LAh_8]QDH46962.1 hypothetical protein LAh9_27 [Aeromonas phage LAh_9]QEG09104.1 hypothetical protein [